uniref:NADH-ubiquinone oxidoreductase chain 2 n=1 Tax=Leptobelus gazella TaxID=1030472 RepID=V9I127_LEPGZ|nr:NADH dehydrogenase subunit 2 [Leptobelus gazella]AEE89598.1 NADH dehydrogenase subunit 2 [Leptobelus gazella]
MLLNLEIMFHFCMMMGVIIATGSNNWFTMWIGLELSLMSFIPIMSNKTKLNSESCIKYFIIQSLSSSIMMMGVIMMSTSTNYKLMLALSIMLKLGMSPFHTWVISIAEGINYNSIFIMLTIMKLAPINMLSYMSMNLSLLIIMSLIMGSISGLNQNSIKKMISYSSIFNLSFIISCINNFYIWITYFIIYSISLLLMTMIIMKTNFLYVNQLILNNFNKSIKLTLWMILLSMGGFPPLLGFFGKLMVLMYIFNTKNSLMLMLMILGSLIVMFFYMRMIFLSIMFFSDLIKWNISFKIKFNSFILISTLMIPIILFNLKS